MTSETDHTLPGPAGLFFDCTALTPSGWHQEHTARTRLERWCSYCGQTACYGYGETISSEGILTCSDASCRASAEAEIARRDCPTPPTKPLSPTPQGEGSAAMDLFGRAA